MKKDHGQTRTLLVGHGTLATARIFGWILIFFFVFQGTAPGQSSTYARLVGTVTDQTEAVVPGVEVMAVANATNLTIEAITDDKGNYVIDKLIPGLYGVSAELPGFKRKVHVVIPLAVSQVARVDFNLEPGEMIETVVVTGYLPIIDTDDAELGAVVDESRILDMPLKDRDLVKLAYLTTGASHQDSYVGASVMNPYGGFFPAFNGLYAFSNQITLDGSANQSAMTMNPVVQATPETIQEFKVITNNYSAEYGRVGGAVISMLSKSGSNELHGHAWYYFRDEAFDAADFFTNKLGGEKLPVNYQIFGGSIGGPIIKDRTFFHAHYERFIDDFEQVDFATVPSIALRTGDLRGAGASGPIPQLYNPFDVVDGQRSPFDGNQIPRSLWNPIYIKVMELIPPPEPNVPGVSDRNFSFPNTRNTRINKYSLRGDHHLASGDTLFGRFSWQNTPEVSHGRSLRVGLPGAELHGINRSRSERSRGWQTAIGWVNPMGSNLVTEFNASIWKTAWLVSEPLHRTNFADLLGYDDADRNPVFYPDGSRGPGNVPRINLEDYTGWGGTFTTPLSDWGLGFKYTASWRRGNHYFKFGFNHSRNLDVNFSQVGPHAGGGDYFDGFAAGQINRDEDGSISGATFGDPWADFMLGLPRSTFGNSLGLANSYSRFNQSHYNAFVNDDWKLGSNLTLNLGLRWEQPLPPYYEGSPDGSFSTDYYYCAIDYSQSQGRIDPVQIVPQGFDIPLWQGSAALAVPFQNLSRRGCYEPRWNYFAPRFGLAWRMFGTNRTVLRFGAGLNYDQGFSLFQAQPLGPARGRINVFEERGAETPSLFLGRRLGLPTQLNTGEHSSGQFLELDWQEGRIYSYNLSIQHEIFRGTKLEIGYVGNQGRHLRVTSAFNSAMPEGYVVPLIDGSTVALTSDPISAGAPPGYRETPPRAPGQDSEPDGPIPRSGPPVSPVPTATHTTTRCRPSWSGDFKKAWRCPWATPGPRLWH